MPRRTSAITFSAAATSETSPVIAGHLLWDFGDGQTATGASVSHAYTGTEHLPRPS